MKNFILLSLAIALTTLGVQSQTLPYSENFESYTVGGFLTVQNSTWWTTWSNTPGGGEDALIKNDNAHSPAKSVLIDATGNAKDILLKLGNRTTGKYELSWWCYVGTNKCGYYSILHDKPAATDPEYAMSVYFRQTGSGELFAGSNTPVLFTYPQGTWFKVKHLIDLDADKIKLYVNGVKVNEWPFSYQALLTTGMKQLNSADFFAGIRTGSAESPQSSIDDIYFAQLSTPGDPVIGALPASLSAYLKPSSSDTRQITVSNTGSSNLDYNLNIILGGISVGKQGTDGYTAPVLNTDLLPAASAAISASGSTRGPDATAVLKYDGDNSTAIGWNALPATVSVASRFPNATTLPYAGMFIESVDVYINQLNATGNQMTLKIFGMGTNILPGALLRSQAFTPVAKSWQHIVLSTPLLVNGEDFWVGYQFTQTDADIYIAGTDAGPNNPNGDFYNIGTGWLHLSNNATLPYNWNIRANLTGDAILHWFAVDQVTGTIAPAGNKVLNVSIVSTGLNLGIYRGIIRILSDDPAKRQLDVPCTLSISVGIDEPGKVAVLVYPNPAENRLNILSPDKILKVSVLSNNGKTILTGNENTIDISSLAAGVYFIRTQTVKGFSNIKFTKK